MAPWSMVEWSIGWAAGSVLALADGDGFWLVVFLATAFFAVFFFGAAFFAGVFLAGAFLAVGIGMVCPACWAATGAESEASATALAAANI